eukprot:gene22715-biopygen8184
MMLGKQTVRDISRCGKGGVRLYQTKYCHMGVWGGSIWHLAGSRNVKWLTNLRVQTHRPPQIDPQLAPNHYPRFGQVRVFRSVPGTYPDFTHGLNRIGTLQRRRGVGVARGGQG